MIALHTEWQDAPGVRDPVLAQTWCRLSIEVNGKPVIQLTDNRVQGSRDGVYGSAFPLCCWIIENWWFLHHEAYRHPDLRPSRELATRLKDREWVQRHSLLVAGEGGAMPDLMLFRDRDAVVARWWPDGSDATHSFLRFAGEGDEGVGVKIAERGLADFVDRVLRLVGNSQAPEVEAARRNWTAIADAADGERQLCASAARLGVDPYDPDELPDDCEELLRKSLLPLEADLRTDLLDVSTVGDLPADVAWISANSAGTETTPDLGSTRPRRSANSGPAHEAGYEFARSLRRELSIPNALEPTDVVGAMRRLGWVRRPASTSHPASRIDAMIVDRGNRPAAVLPPNRSYSSERNRFPLARALFLRETATEPVRRLVTGAYTWEQRASRAFAAELLVPAESLAEKIGSRVFEEDIHKLADRFQVSPFVVKHQIENHGLASLTDG